MTGARDGLARSVQVRLARHAKAIGVDPNLVLPRYAVERFLYRLSRARLAQPFCAHPLTQASRDPTAPMHTVGVRASRDTR
jgi:hypothetical protein